jgi:hypothetical protein
MNSFIQISPNEKNLKENETKEEYDFFNYAWTDSYSEQFKTTYNLPLGLELSQDSPEINGETLLLSSNSRDKGKQQIQNDLVRFFLFTLDYYTKVILKINN